MITAAYYNFSGPIACRVKMIKCIDFVAREEMRCVDGLFSKRYCYLASGFSSL